MIRMRIASIALLCLALAAVASASWYDDYDAGLAAAQRGDWNTVVQKMTSAIRGNGKEDNRARTYGAIFINYHPYYYRGVAYLNLGKYQQAIDDLDKAQGAGEQNFGSVETLHQRAQAKLDAMSTPAPEPQPPAPQPPAPQPRPVVPVPQPQPMVVPAPAMPSMDPALRQRAEAAVNGARGRLAAAQQRRATASPQYTQAVQQLADANTRLTTAHTNDDLNAAIAAAGNAQLFADAATAPGVPATPQPQIAATPSRPAAAADAALAQDRQMLRTALQNYFDGEFEAATRDLTTLSSRMPKNAWIWAFLGASQYSQYAFEADEQYRKAALESFRKAKSLRRWNDGLPSKYFSRRIRRVFANVG